MEGQDSNPLPEDPALAEVSTALRDTGHWGWVVDHRWRLVYATDELRLTFGGRVELARWAVGAHAFGPEARPETPRKPKIPRRRRRASRSKGAHEAIMPSGARPSTESFATAATCCGPAAAAFVLR